MGRFTKTFSPNFVRENIFTPPIAMQARVLQGAEEGLSLATDNIGMTQLANDSIEFLDLPEERRIVEDYQKEIQSEIDDITKEISGNTTNFSKSNMRIKALQRRLVKDTKTGVLKSVGDRLNTAKNFVKENKDKAGFAPVNSKSLQNLNESLRSDPLSSFSPTFTERPEVLLKYQDAYEKMKAQHKDSLTEDGMYIIGEERLTEEDLQNLTWDLLQSQPEFVNYAKQQGILLGQEGYVEDGKLISPFMYVDGAGNEISLQDAKKLSPEEKNKVQRHLNFKSAFAGDLKSAGSIYGVDNRTLEVNPLAKQRQGFLQKSSLQNRKQLGAERLAALKLQGDQAKQAQKLVDAKELAEYKNGLRKDLENYKQSFDIEESDSPDQLPKDVFVRTVNTRIKSDQQLEDESIELWGLKEKEFDGDITVEESQRLRNLEALQASAVSFNKNPEIGDLHKTIQQIEAGSYDYTSEEGEYSQLFKETQEYVNQNFSEEIVGVRERPVMVKRIFQAELEKRMDSLINKDESLNEKGIKTSLDYNKKYQANLQIHSNGIAPNVTMMEDLNSLVNTGTYEVFDGGVVPEESSRSSIDEARVDGTGFLTFNKVGVNEFLKGKPLQNTLENILATQLPNGEIVITGDMIKGLSGVPEGTKVGIKVQRNSYDLYDKAIKQAGDDKTKKWLQNSQALAKSGIEQLNRNFKRSPVFNTLDSGKVTYNNLGFDKKVKMMRAEDGGFKIMNIPRTTLKRKSDGQEFNFDPNKSYTEPQVLKILQQIGKGLKLKTPS